MDIIINHHNFLGTNFVKYLSISQFLFIIFSWEKYCYLLVDRIDQPEARLSMTEITECGARDWLISSIYRVGR